jgi:hypothetical protein
LWEARYFLTWQLDRSGVEGLNELTVGDIDSYMDLRGSKLTRSSLKSTAERLRSLLRYIHRTARVAADLSPHIISPRLYTYEGVPSILSATRSPRFWQARAWIRRPPVCGTMRYYTSSPPMGYAQAKSVTCGSKT